MPKHNIKCMQSVTGHSLKNLCNSQKMYNLQPHELSLLQGDEIKTSWLQSLPSVRESNPRCESSCAISLTGSIRRCGHLGAVIKAMSLILYTMLSRFNKLSDTNQQMARIFK